MVFIKQVPDTDDVKWTPNNNIDRVNTESIMNIVDKEALYAAITLKNKLKGNVTAVSMGPNKAVDILKEAIALGADDAALLSDSKFVGSDTLATSKVLTAAIKEKYPQTDLLLFGQSASDGETAQTGPYVATRLDMPCVNFVTEILDVADGYATVISETEQEKITYKVKLPAVLCINNYVVKPELPRIDGYINAHNHNYKIFNIYELKLSENETGIKGSPTYVSNVYKHHEGRDCKIIGVDELINELKRCANE